MFSADLGVNQVVSNPPATDPPFQKVALLLHGDGTNGAQNNTFVDSSSNNFSITRTGNVAQGTFSPFSLAEGQWSNYFDGTGDYLQAAYNSALIPASGQDFTAEGWIYITAGATSFQFIIGMNNLFAADWQITNESGTLNVSASGVGGNIGAATANTWIHVAVVRSGSRVYGFYNGSKTLDIAAGTQTYNSIPFRVGARNGTDRYFTGYVSNVRVNNTTALYTSNFTPSTTPLTAVSGTSLLTCQSNRFKDNSSNNFTITRNGDTKVTAFSPFAPSAAYSASTNGGSGYFDGSGDYLSAAYGSGLNLSTNNFTIEGWFYFNSTASGQQVLTGYSNVSTNRNFAFYMPSSGTISYYLSSNGTSWDIASGVTIGTVTANTWYHLALVRNGTTFTPYINGIAGTTATSSSAIYNGSSPVILGADSSGASNYNGYASNLRIVNGTAVYTSNFTPPTAPLTAITNTSLLLSCTNAGIYDNAIKNDIETVGNAQVSTSVKKYGTGSMAFDGTGDYLVVTSNPNLDFGTGDFTIEMWVNPTSLSNSPVIYAKVNTTGGSADNGWFIEILNSGEVLFGYGTSSALYYMSTSGAGISTGSWSHIAFVRQGAVVTCYKDGVLKGTKTLADAASHDKTNNLYIGRYFNQSGFDFNGYIDDLRITKGQALYTSNFTPPAQAFPDV